MKRPVIIAAVRTPIGGFNGSLSALSAPQLGAVAIRAAVHRSGLKGAEIDRVIMGNVLSAGLGQAPARQAALAAGLPDSVAALTVNKVCGSGLEAVILAAQAISLGDARIVVAGGMESMSRTPYLLSKARNGYRMGHGELVDAMLKDGLWDVYNDFHMAEAAENCAERLGISREEQDRFALSSYRRALKAQQSGGFRNELEPVSVCQKDGREHIVDEDEEPKRLDLTRLPLLSPAFRPNGTITAANASSIADGAAALLLMAEEEAKARGLSSLARIAGYSVFATKPEWFPTAPCSAIVSLLQKSGRSVDDIDLFEINEAFAASSVAVNRRLAVDPARVNTRGGAIALGHPLGASGARILTTLLHAMADARANSGVASLCIGGGEALALLVERVA